MARRVKVDLVGDASSLNRAFKSAGIQANRFGRETKRSHRIAAAAFKATAAVGAAAGFVVFKVLKDSIKQAMEAQKVDAQTAAVLKSTGGAAGVTSKHVERLATRLMRLTATDDEAVQSVENLVLTFRTIRNEAGKNNDVFDQTVKAVLDMSAALGQDTKSSAIQLGKALGDPVRGMTALRRVGVIFTDDQTKMIKKLAESGHLLEAQKMILKEVGKEFGGSAQKGARTFSGQMRLLGIQVDNIKEAIGRGLLPQITAWVRRLNVWLAQAKNQRKIIQDIRVAVRIMAGAFRFAAAAIRAIVRVVRLFINVGRTLVRINNRIETSFKTMWMGAKKHVTEFYNWMKRMGIKIALAIIEPFTHLPGFLGGGKFQKIKAGLEAELASMDPKAKAAAKRKGAVISPVTGAIPGAGGRLQMPGVPAPRGHGHGRQTQPRHETTVHTHVHVDGREVAKSTTKHQRRSKRRTTAQRTGRHPGAVLD